MYGADFEQLVTPSDFRPQLEPPGGTFRHSYLQGFSYLEESEIDAVIHDLSQKFQGTSYNLLTQNCNHFTSQLCIALTSRAAPNWLNRAASIGLALPCVVPKDWIAPPDHDTADGELLDDEYTEEDERSAMLGRNSSKGRPSDTLNGRRTTHPRGPPSGRRPKAGKPSRHKW
jgi:deubiquitinase DESI2